MVEKACSSSSSSSKRQREPRVEHRKRNICIYNCCSESVIDVEIHRKTKLKVLFLFSSVLIFAHIVCAKLLFCALLLYTRRAVLLSLVCEYSLCIIYSVWFFVDDTARNSYLVFVFRLKCDFYLSARPTIRPTKPIKEIHEVCLFPFCLLWVTRFISMK